MTRYYDTRDKDEVDGENAVLLYKTIQQRMPYCQRTRHHFPVIGIVHLFDIIFRLRCFGRLVGRRLVCDNRRDVFVKALVKATKDHGRLACRRRILSLSLLEATLILLLLAATEAGAAVAAALVRAILVVCLGGLKMLVSPPNVSSTHGTGEDASSAISHLYRTSVDTN